jgi:hypothetical protein
MFDHSLDYPATVFVEREDLELIMYLFYKTFEDLRMTQVAHVNEDLLEDMIATEVGAALDGLTALDYLLKHLLSHIVREHFERRLDDATPVQLH